MLYVCQDEPSQSKNSYFIPFFKNHHLLNLRAQIRLAECRYFS